MKISAILCNFNGAAYLQQAIDSVFNQQREVDEFIIVDDGSTDHSKELILDSAGKSSRVRFVEHGQNMGQAAGFNTAIEKATGDLLCFIDSDDVWFPSKVKAIESLADAETDSALLQHNLCIIEGEKETSRLYREYMAWGDLWSKWFRGGHFPGFSPTTGITLRAGIAHKLCPVPLHLKHSADSFLTRAAIPFGPVSTITRGLGGYRMHDSNAVLGNESHDHTQFFLNQVAPSLDTYYKENNLISPVAVMLPKQKQRFRDTILDFSLRKGLRQIKRMAKTV